METKKKEKIYVLTIVSTCLEGQDIHSYTFKKKKDAQVEMKKQYAIDKVDPTFDKSLLKKEINANGYEIYEEGRFVENHIVAKIFETEVM